MYEYSSRSDKSNDQRIYLTFLVTYVYVRGKLKRLQFKFWTHRVQNLSQMTLTPPLVWTLFYSAEKKLSLQISMTQLKIIKMYVWNWYSIRKLRKINEKEINQTIHIDKFVEHLWFIKNNKNVNKQLLKYLRIE